jgi:hypothetical protein
MSRPAETTPPRTQRAARTTERGKTQYCHSGARRAFLGGLRRSFASAHPAYRFSGHPLWHLVPAVELTKRDVVAALFELRHDAAAAAIDWQDLVRWHYRESANGL